MFYAANLSYLHDCDDQVLRFWRWREHDADDDADGGDEAEGDHVRDDLTLLDAVRNHLASNLKVKTISNYPWLNKRFLVKGERFIRCLAMWGDSCLRGGEFESLHWMLFLSFPIVLQKSDCGFENDQKSLKKGPWISRLIKAFWLV